MGDDVVGGKRFDAGTAGRPPPDCPSCGERMRFDGGRQVHDLWAERFVCDACERETYRSYGRGSV